jgi:hypothetical protein
MRVSSKYVSNIVGEIGKPDFVLAFQTLKPFDRRSSTPEGEMILSIKKVDDIRLSIRVILRITREGDCMFWV